MITILLVTVFFYGAGHEPLVHAVLIDEGATCLSAGRSIKDHIERRKDVKDVEYICVSVKPGNKG